MQKEMQVDLKKDVESGKIFGLRLIKTDNEVIEHDCYAEMFETVREIVGFDDRRFYLKTRMRDPHYLGYNGVEYTIPDFAVSSFKYSDCEAYYETFNYYDGNILRSVNEFPAAVNEEDKVSVTEYEVIWGY